MIQGAFRPRSVTGKIAIAMLWRAVGDNRTETMRSRVTKYTRTQCRFEDAIVLTIVHAVRRYYTKYTQFAVENSDRSLTDRKH